MTQPLCLGVDIGNTKIAVSLWRGDERIGGARWATAADPLGSIDRIVVEAKGLGASRGGLAAIGVSGGGPIDPHRGTILTMPNQPRWRDVAICSLLADAFGAPAAIDNDANACALAEWLWGAGRGSRHLAFLTCSTGIGAGLILDGRIYRGARFLAGEVGHQVIVPEGDPCGCGNRGCLEAYASGAGMARRLAARRPQWPAAPGDAKALIELAAAGDATARAFLEETASFLALGLANLIYTLNPDRIVLGTLAVGAGELLLEPLRRGLRRLVWPQLLEGLEIRAAGLGMELGDHAARAVAAEIIRPTP